MAFLHYGSDLRIQLDLAATKRAMQTIGCTRPAAAGSPRPTQNWSFLVSASIPYLDQRERVIHEGSPPTTRGAPRCRGGHRLAVDAAIDRSRRHRVCGPEGKHDAARIAYAPVRALDR
jgi:hypothetical protein